jgi:hypothetical protein
MRSELTLQQAVFGYRAGHNMLASSCPLSPDSRRMLARLTDASGPWPPSGFDSVITGTPLPDAPYYALFCTWPAPEMHRPGCVWSHVLLIELADLASFQNLATLKQLFKRPSIQSTDSFGEPIKSFTEEQVVPLPLIPDRSDTRRFLLELYSNPRTPAVFEAAREDIYSDLIFELWSQQWPRLRRNFRFSTGSFGDRSRGGPSFDLQIAPLGLPTRFWHKDESLELNDRNFNDSGGFPSWIDTAVSDVWHGENSVFRSFLNTFGADIKDPRAAFIPLTACFNSMIVYSGVGWTDVLKFVGKSFPNPVDAIRLKQHVIAPESAPHPSSEIDRFSGPLRPHTIGTTFMGKEL